MLKNSTNYSTNFIFWVERAGGPISIEHLFYSLEFGPNKQVNWIFLSFTAQICVCATHILDSPFPAVTKPCCSPMAPVSSTVMSLNGSS